MKLGRCTLISAREIDRLIEQNLIPQLRNGQPDDEGRRFDTLVHGLFGGRIRIQVDALRKLVDSQNQRSIEPPAG
jgi:hypothetical protein